MARAVRLSDYTAATVMALRREASSTLHAIGLPSGLSDLGGLPDALSVLPEDVYAPNRERGEAILNGHFTLAGESLSTDGPAATWLQPAPTRAFARRLHAFGWMRDCLAADPEAGPDAIRRYVDSWIDNFGRWNSFAWSHDILSMRLLNWLRCGDALFNGDEDSRKARQARFRSLLRQARYLQRSIAIAPDGTTRLQSAAALTLTGLCLPGRDALQRAGFQALAREVQRQILPDGGHVTRSPRACAEALIDLVTVREAAQAAGADLPQEVRRAIDRLAPMVRFFRMSDDGLASFHGGGEGDRHALKAALDHDDTRARPFGFAPHSGYHRAEAGEATVLLDVGNAPKGPLSTGAHASALAFELCTSGGRLVVNCGWHDDQPASWREAVRATAAHSTLILDETSSARLFPPGWKRDLLGPRLATAPASVSARRNEEEMGIWLEGIHEGYREDYGLSHRRRIFLAADGGDVRGEDALFRPVNDGAPDDVDVRWRFAIRFHLHPEVRASLSRDSMSALLVQPNGDGWRFRTDGGPIRLERSVYLAAGAPPQRATQIVVQGEAEPFGAGDRPPNRVRWAFQRLGQVGGAEGETG
ncbi:heparinase II/III family protein [Maricaulis sp.]|uniref:heparinase II/III family protein n=1 Tax=Maricaulis sp. TaxID=1486257 RepID=UPI001B13965D|nr:heparinase II/III family protein [Maricaulis sp.]MBO6763474.1 heparinase II/III family protein [Maricaulis sp.]